MAIELTEIGGGKVLEVVLSGKLVKEDYQQFLPVLKRLVEQNGRIRLLVQMRDFHGWTPGALLEDIKFDAKHFNDIERLAMVGEERWWHGLSVFSRPFTAAAIRYFGQPNVKEAREWLAAN